MEDESLMIKGLFNDLTRTLFSSAIFLDDLHLNLQPDYEFYDSWWLANEQLKRAIEFFLELKSTYFGFQGSIDLGNKVKGDDRSSKLQDRTQPPPMGPVNSRVSPQDVTSDGLKGKNSKRVAA